MEYIEFNDSTDYDQVFLDVKLMFGQLANSGSPCCFNTDINKALCCANSAILAAQYAVSFNDFARFRDAVIKAYECLKRFASKIVQAVIPPPSEIVAYYWNSSTNAVPDLATILTYSHVNVTHNQGIVIPFANTGVNVYSGIAYPVLEPVKTKWEDTVVPTNFGNIGTGSDLFGMYTVVGTYRVIITNYKTQFDNPILFT